jgi:hypothetical protein
MPMSRKKIFQMAMSDYNLSMLNDISLAFNISKSEIVNRILSTYYIGYKKVVNEAMRVKWSTEDVGKHTKEYEEIKANFMSSLLRNNFLEITEKGEI